MEPPLIDCERIAIDIACFKMYSIYGVVDLHKVNEVR